MVSINYVPKVVKHNKPININLDCNEHIKNNANSTQYESIGKLNWEGWAVDVNNSTDNHIGCLVFVPDVHHECLDVLNAT